jgi:methionyl-tRNA synthetase
MKPEITFEDFAKIDLRIGRIETVEAPEDLANLYKLTVDFGAEIGKKTVLAGVRKYYLPEELSGRQVVAVVNLAPKKVKEYTSEGMLLAADPESGPVFLIPNKVVPEGCLVR